MCIRPSFFFSLIAFGALVAAAACSSSNDTATCLSEVACYRTRTAAGVCSGQFYSAPCEACPSGSFTSCTSYAPDLDASPDTGAAPADSGKEDAESDAGGGDARVD